MRRTKRSAKEKKEVTVASDDGVHYIYIKYIYSKSWKKMVV